MIFRLLICTLLAAGLLGLLFARQPRAALAAPAALHTAAPTAAAALTPTATPLFSGGAPTPSPPAPAAPQDIITLPLPDLQTLPPFGLQLITNPARGVKLLRFSNSVANTGLGPLHMRGEMDPRTREVTLIQEVHGPDGPALTRRLGGFEYHAEHGHWHWDGFSVYEVWSLDALGGLEAVLVESGKVGYCMLDSNPATPRWLEAVGRADLTPAPKSYSECGWRRQGISVGWEDTYLRYLPGQTMDVSALDDGVYALRSVVDPEGLLVELDTTNNDALVYFRLDGTRLSLLPDARFARADFFERRYGGEPPVETLLPDRQ